MELKELKTGESPFDEWGREHLVRFAQRCYAALQACQSSVGWMRDDDLRRDPNSPYWNGDGAGAYALALATAVTQEVGYDAKGGSATSENLYRAFYRNYLPLLFTDAQRGDGQSFFPPRYTCDACKSWTTPTTTMDAAMAKFWHATPDCPGEWRVMTPDDLPPVKSANSALEED